MKKAYMGLKAEKIDFGTYNMATTGSTPAGCMQIVANVLNGTNTCQNPPATISYMWILNNPYEH